MSLNRFEEVWTVDFEFRAEAGMRPEVRCMVAHELFSGRRLKLWADELGPTCPFRTDAGVLVVAYFASAEVGCFLQLGWDVPERILDLFVEFRCLSNGLRPILGYGMLGALNYYGLQGVDQAEKDQFRGLARLDKRSSQYHPKEVEDLLRYCQSDVVATENLLQEMEPDIDLGRALLRGRYMAAVARMERAGIPIDTERFTLLRSRWEGVKEALVAKIDADYGVYEGTSFRQRLFAEWLAKNEVPWPRIIDPVTGDERGLALDDDSFKQMARVYPQVASLRELRHSLAEMRLFEDLAVGPDGRNRTLLSPFRARTGRNQPSNSRFIFGPSTWTRGLIKPEPGRFVAYIDWCQQEFGIAAYLSQDPAMMAAYEDEDPYLRFAKMARAVPEDATKESHPKERNLFKICALAVLFSQGDRGLAGRLDIRVPEARHLLTLHRETFRDFWRWSDGLVDAAMLTGFIQTVFGWTMYVVQNQNPRTLRNFPMQGNGAEMMRLACCLVSESGIEVHAPVHDALLVGGKIEDRDEIIARTQALMRKASELTLNGAPIESDVKIVQYPDRYMDKRGRKMWETVESLTSGHLKQ